jgi:hypothetical protein
MAEHGEAKHDVADGAGRHDVVESHNEVEATKVPYATTTTTTTY